MRGKQSLGKQISDEGNLETCVDMLIYGSSGAGKTYRAATAPGPLYVISSDPTGHKSIPFPVDGIVPTDTSELEECILEFRKGGHGYKTLIVDGLSFLHDMMVKEVGWYMHDSMGAKDPDLMPIQGRLKVQSRYKNMIRALVDLSQLPRKEDQVHVIFTTLDERLKEDDRAPFTIRPLLGTQRLNLVLPAFFSIISYIATSDEVDDKGFPVQDRKMLFSSVNGIMARDRLDIFKPYYPIAPILSNYLK